MARARQSDITLTTRKYFAKRRERITSCGRRPGAESNRPPPLTSGPSSTLQQSLSPGLRHGAALAIPHKGIYVDRNLYHRAAHLGSSSTAHVFFAARLFAPAGSERRLRPSLLSAARDRELAGRLPSSAVVWLAGS